MTCRTSLSFAPSSFTKDQIIDRARAMQASAWSEKMLVVHADDDRLTWPERELVNQLGNKLSGGNNGKR